MTRTATVISLTFLLSACSGGGSEPLETDDLDMGNTDTENSGEVMAALDTSLFLDGALLEEASIVDCTLSGGVETTCHQLVITGVPAGSAEVGPFCPETISTGAEDSGIWFDGGGEVYELDGNFIVNLPNLYGDSNWNLYDPETGIVRVTDTQLACEGAAQPNVEEQYKNMCVQCSLEYYDGGISKTVLIPTTPVMSDAPQSIGSAGVGVALNGVVLAAAAPVDAILSNYTIAAFDDCGGHINPNDGYHYHAATDCNTTGAQSDSHAELLGYALDGYGIYGQLDSDGNEHTDLDECRGVSDDTRGYHYHSASAWENMFVGCFTGQIEGESATMGGPGGTPPAR